MSSFPDEMFSGFSSDRAEELSRLALDTARSLGADYADLRLAQRETEEVEVKNGAVQTVESSLTRGFGVRVLVDGAWGFSSSSRVSPGEVERVTREAVSIAAASARVRPDRPVRLAPAEAVRDSWASPVKEDPFGVDLDEKIELLLEADAELRSVEGVRVSEAHLGSFRESTLFSSTEGSHIHQQKTEVGGNVSAVAAESGEMQKRSLPASFRGDWAQAGFEHIRQLNLPGHARRCAQEAVDLLGAPQCPAGEMDLILDPAQMILQIHESVGHPIEMDRVLGMEASLAGTSFLTPDHLDGFRYGSEEMNITADATIPGGLGSFAYDDEGVPGQRVPIIQEGIFVNYLTSRETGPALEDMVDAGSLPGTEPSFRGNGTMRADGPSRLPLVRMTNINLEPGDWTLEEMIQDTEDGLFMATNKSWSIDDKRTNFQFGCEVAWEIKGGSLGRMYKNPTYTGITPQFWGALDAIGSEKEWKVWGIPTCGKGEPVQAAHVGHGTAPARFRGVKVGVGRW